MWSADWRWAAAAVVRDGGWRIEPLGAGAGVVGDAGIGGRGVQPCLVGLTGGDGVLDALVDVEDGALGAVVAPSRLVLALDDGEGLQDVVDCVARRGEALPQPRQLLLPLPSRPAPLAIRRRRQIEVEEGGIQLTAQQEAALLVPAEGRAFVAEVAGEGGEVPRRVHQLKHASRHPLFDALRV